MKDHDMYLLRAAEARAAAEEAVLDNVRDRCLRAEAAWNAMASRAQRTERMRATLAAAKAAESEAEPAPEPGPAENIPG